MGERGAKGKAGEGPEGSVPGSFSEILASAV